jgi:hypothetical protein
LVPWRSTVVWTLLGFFDGAFLGLPGTPLNSGYMAIHCLLWIFVWLILKSPLPWTSAGTFTGLPRVDSTVEVSDVGGFFGGERWCGPCC